MNDEAVTEKLSAALGERLGAVGAAHQARDLLPVVREIAADRAAEEFTRFAADLDRVVLTSDWSVRIPMAGGLDSVAAELRRRADELANRTT